MLKRGLTLLIQLAGQLLKPKCMLMLCVVFLLPSHCDEKSSRCELCAKSNRLKKKAGYAEAPKAILWKVIPAKSCSLIRTELQGCCGGRFQAVLLPPQFFSVYFCH